MSINTVDFVTGVYPNKQATANKKSSPVCVQRILKSMSRLFNIIYYLLVHTTLGEASLQGPRLYSPPRLWILSDNM